MNIRGNKVLLRAIEKEDNEFLRAMINDPELEKNVVGWSFPTSKGAQEEWFNRQLSDRNNLRLIIEYDSKAVGLATLTDIDWKNRKATHGIKLFGEDIKGKGIGTDTVRAIMKYAFEELQLNRLYGSIMTTNIASQKLYEKCGWKNEGLSRQSIFKGNQYIDEIQVGVLREDYERIKEEWK
jgi:RimJ/RimL family protein N-acetyltransferase